MKENMELERSDIWVDRDIMLGDENEQEIVAYLETVFDVEKKFASLTDIANLDWINMYGIFNPYKNSLRIECSANYADGDIQYFGYQPTEAESQLIKEMITEKIREVHNQTPQEFCEEVCGEEITLGGIQ